MARGHTRQEDFLARAASLHSEAHREGVRGRTLKAQYPQARAQLLEQITQLRREADEVAQRFRQRYSAASDAYSAGEKALAKSLSLEGKSVQAECESLNSQASTLRGHLNSLRAEYESAFRAAETAKRQAEEVEIGAKTARTTVVKIATSAGGDDEAVENFLDSLPQSVLQHVQEITHDPNLAWTSADGRTKVESRRRTEWLPGGGVRIQIGSQPKKPGLSSLDVINATIAHELGHVCYDTLSDDSKAEWFALHTETPVDRFIAHDVFDNDEEDFAECFRFHAIEPKTLQKHDVKKALFMKGIFSMFVHP